MIDERLINCENFIIRSQNKFKQKYDYGQVDYKAMKVKVLLTCKIHNYSFQQSPEKHLSSKNGGCIYCCNNMGKGLLTNEIFIEKANRLHNYKYDYKNTCYIKSNLKIEVICKEHGSFYQIPNSHLIGKGCPSCSGNKRYSTFEIIENLKILHKNKYEYDLSNFKNFKTKILVKCSKHGCFSTSVYQLKNGYGCGLCSGKSKGEEKIADFLKSKNIDFERQKSFVGCKFKNEMQFDFFLTKLNILIEYDGIQHFMPIEWFGGLKSFEDQVKKDKIKNEFCEKNNFNLIRIPYKRINEFEKIIYENL